MSEEVKVMVKMLSMGLRSLECTVRMDMTIGDFKKLIEETDSQNVAAERQRLTYDNKELTNDEMLLGDLKPEVAEWSVFTLVLKLDRSQITRSPPPESTVVTLVPQISNENEEDIEMNIASSPGHVNINDVSPPASIVWFQVQFEGSHHTISCNLTDSVIVLKAQVWENTGVLPGLQRLVCNGNIFEDNCLLQSYNLGDRGQTESEPVNVTLVRAHDPIASRENDPDMTADFGSGPEISIEAVYESFICVFNIPMNADAEALKLRISDKFFEDYALQIPVSDQNIIYHHQSIGREAVFGNDRINETVPFMTEGETLIVMVSLPEDIKCSKFGFNIRTLALVLFMTAGCLLIVMAVSNGYAESPPHESDGRCFIFANALKVDSGNDVQSLGGTRCENDSTLYYTLSGRRLPSGYKSYSCEVDDDGRCDADHPIAGTPKPASIIMTAFGAGFIIIAIVLMSSMCEKL